MDDLHNTLDKVVDNYVSRELWKENKNKNNHSSLNI